LESVDSSLLAAFGGAVLGGAVSVSTSVVMELWKTRRASRTAILLLFETVTRATTHIESSDEATKAAAATSGARSVVDAWLVNRTALAGGSTLRELGGLVATVMAVEQLAAFGESHALTPGAGAEYAGGVHRLLEQFEHELRSRGQE
jgi:hypothetical protein